MSRTFLVTGASRAIGSALVHRLTRDGHHVVGVARDAPRDFLGVLLPVELADTKLIDDALRNLTARVRFDGVGNNVGLVRPQRFGAVELPTLEEVMRVHLHPALQAVQALLPRMAEPRWGKIVDILSLTVLGSVERTAYAAKAALASFSRDWALELATTGITVNAVSPGPTETELFRADNVFGSDGEPSLPIRYADRALRTARRDCRRNRLLPIRASRLHHQSNTARRWRSLDRQGRILTTNPIRRTA